MGVTASIPHPDITEILGKIGFDYIHFDTQHTPLSIQSVQIMMQSMKSSQTQLKLMPVTMLVSANALPCQVPSTSPPTMLKRVIVSMPP